PATLRPYLHHRSSPDPTAGPLTTAAPSTRRSNSCFLLQQRAFGSPCLSRGRRTHEEEGEGVVQTQLKTGLPDPICSPLVGSGTLVQRSGPSSSLKEFGSLTVWIRTPQ